LVDVYVHWVYPSLSYHPLDDFAGSKGYERRFDVTFCRKFVRGTGGWLMTDFEYISV